MFGLICIFLIRATYLMCKKFEASSFSRSEDITLQKCYSAVSLFSCKVALLSPVLHIIKFGSCHSVSSPCEAEY